MKLFTTIALAMIVAGSCFAQDKTQGRIVYDIKLNLHAQLKPDQMAMKDMIPEFTTQTVQLRFNGTHALLQEGQQQEEKQEGVEINISGLAEPTYIDMTTKKSLKLKKLNNVSYLISATENATIPSDATIKETNETKKVLGYNCKKIVTGTKTDKMVLWYTTELPVIGSALGIMTDKGVVLEMEGKGISFVATAIDLEKTDLDKLLPPKDAVVISEKEFAKKADAAQL